MYCLVSREVLGLSGCSLYSMVNLLVPAPFLHSLVHFLPAPSDLDFLPAMGIHDLLLVCVFGGLIQSASGSAASFWLSPHPRHGSLSTLGPHP